MSRPCFTLGDVESRLKLILGWFGNDTTEFMIHLSIYLHNHLRQYHPKVVQKLLTYEGDQGKQGEKKKEEKKEKIITNMDDSKSTETTSTETDSIFKSLSQTDDLYKTLSTAIKETGVDLLKLLLSEGKKVTAEMLHDAQKIRRASALDSISKKITSDDGRKLSAIEKKTLVIEEAIKLAETEEAEEDQFDDDDEYEEFAAGDEVIIIEGENCGLFGTLQHSSEGIFGMFGDAVKEDEEGNYGVDIHTESGEVEGYWIHPEAMRLKTYVIGDKVKVIDGINVGRTGTIQSDGKRLRIDDGAYGVDVTMDDGSIEGYWIHPKSMVPLEPKPKDPKEEEDLNLEEVDKFEFLPYIPFPGDAMDEALADALNTFEIDINIKRIITRNKNVLYRYGGKRHIVRYIHGVLLVKENKVWCELIPILRKLGDLPEAESDLFTKKGKK